MKRLLLLTTLLASTIAMTTQASAIFFCGPEVRCKIAGDMNSCQMSSNLVPQIFRGGSRDAPQVRSDVVYELANITLTHSPRGGGWEALCTFEASNSRIRFTTVNGPMYKIVPGHGWRSGAGQNEKVCVETLDCPITYY